MIAKRAKHYITAVGLKDLKREYDGLINQKRPEVILRLQQAREMGDLSENSAYDDAREEQALLEARILDIEKALKSIVVSEVLEAVDFVVIGSKVVCEMNGEIHEFKIVGSVEADPVKGKISNESPVGKALLGTRIGESIEIVVGPVKTIVKIMEIQ